MALKDNVSPNLPEEAARALAKIQGREADSIKH